MSGLYWRYLAVASVALSMAACGNDGSVGPATPSAASAAISDAANNGGTSGFYFLPPIVRAPAVSGTFDGGLTPEVQICLYSAGACQGGALATYTTTTGPGSETVRVDLTSEHYIVNWHTNLFPIVEGGTYRISVRLAPIALGYADVQVFPTAKEAKNAESNEFVGLVDGRTLPIKFRIEQGIAVSIDVQPSPATVILSKTVGFTATLRDAHGNVVTNQPVTWSSTNTAIATVDASAVATGISVGNTYIAASSNNLSASASLTVIPPPVVSVEVTPSTATVIKTKTVQLAAVVKDGDGNVLTGRTVTWASSDPSIAAVDANGLVTGVNLGVVTITATCEGKSGSSEVTVIRPPVASVTVMPNPTSVTTGNTVQLTATLRDADGNVLTGRAVSWQSSNAGVATVDANGLLSGVAVGTVLVSATAEGITGNAHVDVAADGFILASLTAGARVTSCGLDAAGSAYCWGNGIPRPVALNWGFPLKQLTISLFMTCGLAEDGTAYCKGEFVSGRYPKSTTPTAVPAPVKFVQLTEHGFDGPICGLATDGTAWCWGYFDGYGSQAYQISSTLKFVSILSGEGMNCGLTANYELWCWGPPVTGIPSSPVRVQSGHQFKYVTVSHSSCGLDLDSYVWCWGFNNQGEFGNGTTNSIGWGQPAVLGMNGMRFKSIHVGGGKMCGIAFDDEAYCSGQAYLGDGTSTGSLFPKRITSPEALVQVIPSEGNHVCGLTATGAVYCWGVNTAGEVGDGTLISPRLVPTRVVPPLP